MKNVTTGRLGGFTLIELLVVVLIIGILAAIAVPQYRVAVAKAQAAEAITVLTALEKARTAYHLANGTWPTSMDDLDITVKDSASYRFNVNSDSGVLLANSKKGYGFFEWQQPLPGDPVRKWCIVNEYTFTGQKKVCNDLGYTEPGIRIGNNQYYRLVEE